MKFYYTFIFLLITAGFLVFVPKISTRIFPFIRIKYLNSFIEETKRNGTINTRNFWVLREYYSPGYFIFKEKGLTKNEINKATKSLGISLKTNIYNYPFATFHSDKIQSLEVLVDVSSISASLINSDKKIRKDCIIDRIEEYICYINNKTIEMTFIKAMSEMQETNGFFDYKRKDIMELTRNKKWLVISQIHL